MAQGYLKKRDGTLIEIVDAKARTDITGKVDIVAGKGLSTNDYDNTAKSKVDAIPSNPKYTDTVVTDSHINDLIDAKLGVIENGTY